MRVVYYSIAGVATVLACLLWLFVLRQSSVGLPVVSTGVLPVVPKIRLAEPREVLRADLAEGRAFCAGGVYARVVDGQAVTILVDDQPVTCP